ncbi:MAG: AarF/ABC1/UbiB kinase family protein [Bdellovibrio sp.]|nr:AarF/ABC1/UbiB kinase family protein [Bdellovibrio sp.]
MSDNSDKKKKLNQIKSSVFSRGLAVAKIGLNAGFKYAGTKVGGTSFDDFLISQAGSITKEIGQLKGSLMKAGQMLSMYGEYFLPPQANDLLKSLQSDSPAVAWHVMSQYLQQSMSPELLAELEIDQEPIGCASMGQVHKAKIISTGEMMALKIQYPDVEKAIDSDVAALKTLLKFAKILPAGLDLDPIFEEIKGMLRQELDYATEASLTKQYKEKINNDPRFVVPKVFDRYSNKRVLATEYIEGFRADHPLVQALSQKRRNQLSENFLELYLKEIFEWNLVQTDPHLGNYKIQIDPLGNDRVVLLDFGACGTFTEQFINTYRRMIKGSITFDEKMFLQASSDLGFIIPSDSKEYIKVFSDFCYETVEPFWSVDDPRDVKGKIKPDGTYNWKETDLPGRVVKKAVQFKNFDLRSPPREILFLDRKTGGVFIFLSVLKANINARKIIAPFLEQVL